MADSTYQPKVYRKQGGEEFVVASGGILRAESGAQVIIEAGATLTNSGTQTFDDIKGNDVSLAITGADAADATSVGGGVAVAGAPGGATSGVGGTADVTGGAGAAGNSAGGVAATTGGAGQGSAAGGVGQVVGGAGGATGAGGKAKVTGGAGGATSGTGGNAEVAGGAGTNGNANGGDVILTPGAKNGSGKDGDIYTRGVVLKSQGAPAAKTVTAVLSAAEIIAGLITTTGVTAPSIHQLPTGQAIDDELPGVATGDSFDFSIINTGTGASDDATITVNTDVTIVGSPTVGSLTDATIISGSGRFRARRTGAHAWVVYRIA